jgi:hypothetical protein
MEVKVVRFLLISILFNYRKLKERNLKHILMFIKLYNIKAKRQDVTNTKTIGMPFNEYV